MGLLEKLSRKLNSNSIDSDKTSQVLDTNNQRCEMDQNEIDRLQRVVASEEYCEKVYRKYYHFYPIKPYISKDREMNTSWYENPTTIVHIDMMKRYEDGLLPGDVYLLFWIGKKKKIGRIPSYFEYKYGIDFEKEKTFLNDENYLNGIELTEKGVSAIAKHYDVIKNHNPERTSAKEAKKFSGDVGEFICDSIGVGRVFDAKNSVKQNGVDVAIVPENVLNDVLDDIATLNDTILKDVTATLKTDFKLNIPIDKLIIDKSIGEKMHTFLISKPLTKTGKKAKYPNTISFSTYRDGFYSSWGTLSYMQNGQIGDGRLIFWKGKIGYLAEIAFKNDVLSLKLLEKMTGGSKETIYKK